MNTTTLERMRRALWEALEYERNPKVRTIIHKALVAPNLEWVPRVFRWNITRLPLLPIKSSPSLFYRPTREEVAQGDIFVGHSVDGYRVLLPLDAFGLTGDVMVTGVKGAGKTTLLKFVTSQLAEKVGVFVFDTENEYAQALAALEPVFLAIPFENYSRNIFVPPPRCPLAQWLEIVKNYLREDFQLEDSAVNLLSQAFSTLLANGERLSVPSVVRELARSAYRSQSQKALLNRLNGLLNSTDRVFAAQDGLNLSKLENKSLVFVLEGTGLVPRSIFYHDLYSWYSNQREGSQTLRQVWIFDEAHTLFSRMISSRAAMAEPMSRQMFRLARKRGIGLVVGDQIPNYEHPIVRGNIGLKIIFRLGDYSSVQLYTHALGLNAEHQNALMNLPERIALVHHPRIPQPFLVQVPELGFRELRAEDLKQHVGRSLEILGLVEAEGLVPEPAVQATNVSGVREEDLPSKDAQDYLVSIAREPFLAATERDKKLGHSLWKGNAIRKELLKLGLVESVKVNTYKRGGTFVTHVLTEKGRTFLKRVGVCFSLPKGKGGFIHQFWQQKIKAWLEAQGFEAEIEARAPGSTKQVDVGAKMNGQRIAFEVVVCGLEKESVNLIKDLQGWDRVVFCCDRPRTSSILWQKLHGCSEEAEFRLLPSFL